MKDLLVTIVKGLVEKPEQVTVDVDEPNEEGIIVSVSYTHLTLPTIA